MEEESQEEEKKEYAVPEIQYLGDIRDTMQFTVSITVGGGTG